MRFRSFLVAFNDWVDRETTVNNRFLKGTEKESNPFIYWTEKVYIEQFFNVSVKF